MNHEGVCRPAPATPGLLKTKKNPIFQHLISFPVDFALIFKELSFAYEAILEVCQPRPS